MPEIALSRTQGVFDQLYGKLRLKEGRLFSDEDIPYLPQVHSNHPYHKEWVIRKHSCKALINYITHKENFASILEVGCGNGWLCSRIAHAVDAEGGELPVVFLKSFDLRLPVFPKHLQGF